MAGGRRRGLADAGEIEVAAAGVGGNESEEWAGRVGGQGRGILGIYGYSWGYIGNIWWC